MSSVKFSRYWYALDFQSFGSKSYKKGELENNRLGMVIVDNHKTFLLMRLWDYFIIIVSIVYRVLGAISKKVKI